MARSLRLLLLFAVGLGACRVDGIDSAAGTGASRASDTTSDAAASAELHGRLERHAGLRVLRLWGTPEQRGYAHGYLLAEEICTIMRQEFAARFSGIPDLLDQARQALPRLIEYPDPIARELDALWDGVLARGVERSMPKLGRAFDRRDLLVANALDVFGLMGCSSFTVWGEQADGGGVLTARNFDWPLTGDHMLDHTILIVQLPKGAWGTASVAWPGYVGTVTGISLDGVAAYLHVGSATPAAPQPSSWPSAIAARKILESAAQGANRFASAAELLDYTSPPVGFLTHVVLPNVPADQPPAKMFETDTRKCVPGVTQPGPFVVTNHFQTRDDGWGTSPDSSGRQTTLQEGIASCIEVGDKVVDAEEAWRMLASVGAGGGHHFGTLHSLVFRHEPWFFELRVADHTAEGLVMAPESERRYQLTREQVFGDAGKSMGATVPRDAVTYKATACADGSWRFTYPEGDRETVGEVWVEVGKDAQFVVTTDGGFDEQVLFLLPAMRAKCDVIPDRYQTVWFRPTKLGDVHIFMGRPNSGAEGTAAILHVVDAETYTSRPWQR